MKKMVLLIAVCASSLFGSEYCNSHFATFCVQYPNNFIAEPESDSGHGRTIHNKDNTFEMYVYSSRYGTLYNHTKEEALQWIKKDFSKLTFTAHKNDWYVFSGYDKKGNILYVKKYFSKNNVDGISHTLSFNYSEKGKDKFNKIVENIVKTYRYDYEEE